ncbi:hypothetical protein [Bergeyella sp. RCAD1439]|nr:hypothetical protein [Bergeyella sp. RCAD1439]
MPLFVFRAWFAGGRVLHRRTSDGCIRMTNRSTYSKDARYHCTKINK